RSNATRAASVRPAERLDAARVCAFDSLALHGPPCEDGDRDRCRRERDPRGGAQRRTAGADRNSPLTIVDAGRIVGRRRRANPRRLRWDAIAHGLIRAVRRAPPRRAPPAPNARPPRRAPRAGIRAAMTSL